jgi:hypothetical protein
MAEGDIDSDKLYYGFASLEKAKSNVKDNVAFGRDIVDFFSLDKNKLRELLLLYIERSSSRVTSQGSILIRDIVLNISLHVSGYANRSLWIEEDEEIESIIDLIRDGENDIKSIIEEAALTWRSE